MEELEQNICKMVSTCRILSLTPSRPGVREEMMKEQRSLENGPTTLRDPESWKKKLCLADADDSDAQRRVPRKQDSAGTDICEEEAEYGQTEKNCTETNCCAFAAGP